MYSHVAKSRCFKWRKNPAAGKRGEGICETLVACLLVDPHPPPLPVPSPYLWPPAPGLCLWRCLHSPCPTPPAVHTRTSLWMGPCIPNPQPVPESARPCNLPCSSSRARAWTTFSSSGLMDAAPCGTPAALACCVLDRAGLAATEVPAMLRRP